MGHRMYIYLEREDGKILAVYSHWGANVLKSFIREMESYGDDLEDKERLRELLEELAEEELGKEEGLYEVFDKNNKEELIQHIDKTMFDVFMEALAFVTKDNRIFIYDFVVVSDEEEDDISVGYLYEFENFEQGRREELRREQLFNMLIDVRYNKCDFMSKKTFEPIIRRLIEKWNKEDGTFRRVYVKNKEGGKELARDVFGI